MKIRSKPITKLFAVMLALALILPTLNDIKINAASARRTVYTAGFENGNDGWSAQYGGNVSLSSEKSYTGSYSLKITNRKKAWHSQGKNIYSIIKNNGAGMYRISMKVLITALNPTDQWIGMLIRTTGENSFSTNNSGNYFCRLAAINSGITTDTWITVSGEVVVAESDISASSGQFKLMLDLIEPTDGQAVYIDDVLIEKSDEFTAILRDRTVLIGEETKINTNKSSGVTFTSLNSDKAYISSSGEIVALKPGFATFKVQYAETVRSCTLRIKTPTTATEGITSGECYYLKNEVISSQSTDLQLLRAYIGINADNELKQCDVQAENLENAFRFEYVTDGVYKISVKSDGRDVLDGLGITRNSLQRWYVIKVGSGYKIIRQGDYKMIALTSKDGEPALTNSALSADTWKLKNSSINFTGNQLYGASSSTYGASESQSTCRSGYRGSATVAADNFVYRMSVSGDMRQVLFNRHNNAANKDDVRSKSEYTINKTNIDDVDFMLFVGHGFGSKLHYDYDSEGRCHSENIDGHDMYDNAFIFTHEEAKFGKGSSRTKWFTAFSCNYLNEELYSRDELIKKMEGANIVLGFSTKCFLTTTQTEDFADKLLAGKTIIDAWTEAAQIQKKHMSNRTVAAAMFVEEARNDTIYNYYPDSGTYRTEDIKFIHVVVR